MPKGKVESNKKNGSLKAEDNKSEKSVKKVKTTVADAKSSNKTAKEDKKPVLIQNLEDDIKNELKTRSSANISEEKPVPIQTLENDIKNEVKVRTSVKNNEKEDPGKVKIENIEVSKAKKTAKSKVTIVDISARKKQKKQAAAGSIDFKNLDLHINEEMLFDAMIKVGGGLIAATDVTTRALASLGENLIKK